MGTSSRELVRQTAEEARAAGFARPAHQNVVTYYSLSIKAFEALFAHCLAFEHRAISRDDRRAAKAWAFRLAKLLRDLKQPSALEVVQSGPNGRALFAQKLAVAVWDEVAGWDRDRLEEVIVKLLGEVRWGMALLGEAGPFYRRAPMLIRGCERLLNEHGALARARDLVAADTSRPLALAGDAPEGDGIAGAVRGEGQGTSSGATEEDEEEENGARDEPDGASPRTSREGDAEGLDEPDGWES